LKPKPYNRVAYVQQIHTMRGITILLNCDISHLRCVINLRHLIYVFEC